MKLSKKDLRDTTKMADEWTKFDPNDPKTFPKNSDDILIFLEAEGFIPQPAVAFFENGCFYSLETGYPFCCDEVYWSSGILKKAAKKLLTSGILEKSCKKLLT